MTDIPHEGTLEAIVKGAVAGPGLSDLVVEYEQIGLDGVLGVAGSELPVIKTLIAAVRSGIAVRDRLFVKKLLDLLAGFRDVSDWERRDMISRLEADASYGRRVGEHLMELLDRIESSKKPSMVSRVFGAYAKKEIDGNMLSRLNFSVERIPFYAIADIRAFGTRAPGKPFELTAATIQDFVNAGLANIGAPIGGLSYLPNDVCAEFLRLGLDKC